MEDPSMPETRLGVARVALIAGLSALTVGLGLGRAGRLTYHEAFVTQAAREMIAGGDVLVPTIGGRPWLEKPPLPIWLVALAGTIAGAGELDEARARAPAAIAATLLAMGTATLAARRFGRGVGLLAGLVQATTAWTVVRGRLAEADVILACLVTWTLVAFDRIRVEVEVGGGGDEEVGRGRRAWRRLFWVGLGLTALVKGIGFGAALVGVTVALVIAWDRDAATLRRLRSPRGWALTGLLALSWPALVVLRHPQALGLWTFHVAGRLAERPEHFAGGPWWQYGPAILVQVLPWTPLALVGAARSLARAVRHRDGAGDRLLWAWAVGPVALLSMATVRNAHYIIHALPPWSIWAALGLLRLGARLRGRGWAPARLRRWAWAGFAGLGLGSGLGFAALGPWLDRHGRGAESAFYEVAGRSMRPGEPLVLLYDDWDRLPYPTPFGPVPHDLAVRLYYLDLAPDRPPCWRFGVDSLAAHPPARDRGGVRGGAFALIGRDRDVPALRRLGRVETLARGPVGRARRSKVDDRTYRLFRITPEVAMKAEPTAAR